MKTKTYIMTQLMAAVLTQRMPEPKDFERIRSITNVITDTYEDNVESLVGDDSLSGE
jgi:hypothetical protein